MVPTGRVRSVLDGRDKFELCESTAININQRSFFQCRNQFYTKYLCVLKFLPGVD